MSPSGAQTRKRDSTATRRDLLNAAIELFGERAYDVITLRDIGERAGVDAALVARYFGSKSALYLEALRMDYIALESESLEDRLDELVDRSLERYARGRVGVITRALFDPYLEPDLRQAAAEEIRLHLFERVYGGAREAISPSLALRIELGIAALMGVAIQRLKGNFEALGTATDDELGPLMKALLRSIVFDGEEAP